MMNIKLMMTTTFQSYKQLVTDMVRTLRTLKEKEESWLMLRFFIRQQQMTTMTRIKYSTTTVATLSTLTTTDIIRILLRVIIKFS